MKLKAAVDRGLEIVRQIEALKKELELVETAMECAALTGDQIELEDPERDGRQFLATGSSHIVPVVITADVLVKSFVHDSKAHVQIAAAAEGKIEEFFKPTKTWKALFDSGKIFRRKAREILGDEIAAPFITACVSRDKHGVPKNAIKIEWNRSELIEKGAPAA